MNNGDCTINHYHLQYEPGLCGTFAVWLINQHANFPKYEQQYYKGSDEFPDRDTDIICHGADWHWQDEPYDASFTGKRCYKTQPVHAYVDNWTKLTRPFVDNIRESYPIDYHILTVYMDDMNHMHTCAKRYADISDRDVRKSMEVFTHYNLKVMLDQEYLLCREVAKSYYAMDIGKIIFKLNDEEYFKLCRHIGEQPLTDWKKHVRQYRDYIFDGYL